MKTVAIVDYKAGNLRSISQAIKKLGGRPLVSNDREIIEGSDYIVLPGVGSFSCIRNLRSLKSTLVSEMQKKPFLGICLGMQALFEGSEESANGGLAILKGKVRKLSGKVKVPQIGWNTVQAKKDSALFNGIPQNSYFYFVHSYAACPNEKRAMTGTTLYGRRFASAIEKGNLMATQFHPEKSGKNGLKLLNNFLALG